VRKTLSDKGVAALKPRAQRYAFPDPELRGHFVRVQPSGSRTFVTVARDPNGKQVWTTIGAADVLKIEEAREQARNAIRRVKAGQPALEAPPAKPDSLQAVAVCTENLIHIDDMRESPKLTRWLRFYALCLRSWPHL
jgi:hypothetical protein